MDQPQVSVKAWGNYKHWDKSRGGLQVQVKDGETVRKEKLRKKILWGLFFAFVAILVIIIIVVVVVYNLPEEKIVQRVPETLKIFDSTKPADSNSPQCEWPYLVKNGKCDYVIQDNKACNFDVEDCQDSNECYNFKQTLTCEEAKEYELKLPQCVIDPAQICSAETLPNGSI